MRKLTVLPIIAFCLLVLSGCSSWASLNPLNWQLFSTSADQDENSQVEQENASQEEEKEAQQQVAKDKPTSSKTKPAADTPIKNNSLNANSSAVDVIWQVPGDSVEKYHIYFGLQEDELTNHIEISVSELEKMDHPKFGPVFRYQLKAIPAGESVYISLKAENKYGISDGTPPAKVEPGQRTVNP